MTANVCHYCGTPDLGTPETELRPYGPGGSTVCLPCVDATPERQVAAKAIFHTLLDAAEAISPTGVVAIGEADGPRPFDPREPHPHATPEPTP